ncbi:hypothetical protein [Arthrobacter sp. HLT1-20]
MNASTTVRMVAKVSGTRNGQDWPAPGETIAVPVAEAKELLANGMAISVQATETATASTAGTETATVPGNQSLRAAAKAEADKVAAEAADKAAADQAAADAAKANAEAAAAETKATKR